METAALQMPVLQGNSRCLPPLPHLSGHPGLTALPDKIAIFAKKAGRSVAPRKRGGKSGQQRAPCFLTGRQAKVCSRVTENDRPGFGRNKGEKAG